MPAENDTPGWYGKIPAAGDFVSRRLPHQFIDIWHDWLQQGISASRQTLQEQWLDSYLNGPIWRFLLTPGICGDVLWTGTLMPSVDKVGRYFPLTLTAQLNPANQNLATVAAAHDWFNAMEQLSLSMLDVNAALDFLERELESMPFPNNSPENSKAGKEFLHWWKATNGGAKSFELVRPGALADLAQNSLSQELTAGGLGKSLWWSAHHTKLHCFTGMPPTGFYSMLLEDDSVTS